MLQKYHELIDQCMRVLDTPYRVSQHKAAAEKLRTIVPGCIHALSEKTILYARVQ